MKINLIIISLLFLVSCRGNQEQNWCEEGIEKAEKEIVKEEFIFVKYITLVGGADRYDKELEVILNQSKIRFQYETISQIESESKERDCYQKTMLNGIKNKFGEDFIEKISKEADEMFANRENYIFEDLELDEKPYFINPKGKNHSGEELIRYLNKHLNYPDEYELAKTVEERPFVELEFIVDKRGEPKEFKINNSVFPKEKEKFKEYLENEVLKIISEIPKWESGKIHDKRVDTRFTRRIPLDWII